MATGDVGVAGGTFTGAVTAWVAQTKARTLAVRNEAAQRIVEEMNTAGPSVANPGGGQGGHVPVDTGFLHASLLAINGTALPSVRMNPSPDARYSYDEGQVGLVIADAAITDTLTFVYTANYSKYMEEKYAFVRLAAQNWPAIVQQTVADAKSRVK